MDDINSLIAQYTAPTQKKAGGPLRGPGSATSDSIPAVIDKAEPAALSDGEYVITAAAVYNAGGGNTEAGFAFFDEFMAVLERMNPNQAAEFAELTLEIANVIELDPEKSATGGAPVNDQTEVQTQPG